VVVRAPHPPWSTIGKLLRGLFEDTAKEPVPARWVDLINNLNEREQAERHADADKQKPTKPQT
jgi:hypothetical protein